MRFMKLSRLLSEETIRFPLIRPQNRTEAVLLGKARLSSPASAYPLRFPPVRKSVQAAPSAAPDAPSGPRCLRRPSKYRHCEIGIGYTKRRLCAAEPEEGVRKFRKELRSRYGGQRSALTVNVGNGKPAGTGHAAVPGPAAEKSCLQSAGCRQHQHEAGEHQINRVNPAARRDEAVRQSVRSPRLLHGRLIRAMQRHGRQALAAGPLLRIRPGGNRERQTRKRPFFSSVPSCVSPCQIRFIIRQRG